MAKTGFFNGSDMLLYVGGKAVGHCTSHQITHSTETKDRTFKPAASEAMTKALFKNKGIVGLSISISADGLVFYGESENGYRALSKAWHAAEAVDVKIIERKETSSSTEPSTYLAGKFVVTNLDRTDPAQDDSTYTVSLENDGAPTTFDDTALSDGTTSAS